MPWLLQNVCKLRRPLYMATVVFLHRQSFLSQTLGTDGVIIPAVAVMTQADAPGPMSRQDLRVVGYTLECGWECAPECRKTSQRIMR